MRISPEVEIALSLAANEAARRRNELVTLEHLLFALLFDDATALVVKHAGGDVAALKKALESFLDAELTAVPEEDFEAPTASLGVQRVIRRADAHVRSSGKDEIKGHNVLVAIFAEPDSHAVSLLEQHGVPHSVHFKTGERATVIAAEARRLRCQRIVLSTARKSSITRMIEDSTTSRVLEHTTVPVEVIAGDAVPLLERWGVPAGVGAALTLLLMAAD